MIRVITEKRFQQGRVEDIVGLLAELSRKEREQDGCLSDEILQSVADPSTWVDVSTWTYSDQWKKWRTTQEYKKIQLKMKDLLAAPDEVSVFTIIR